MRNYFSALIVFPIVIGYHFFVLKTDNYPDSKNLPSVKKTNNQELFYIERSKNKNRIYYDANFKSNGQIDANKPIDVYWLNLEENYGKRGELSYIQEKLAYGYTSRKLGNLMYEIKLKAFCNRPLIMFLDRQGKVKTQLEIQGKQAILQHLFIKATDKGILTKVEYIELFGYDSNTNKCLYEKIIP